MSLFAVGGSAGFALAPVLLTPAVLLAGLPGTAVVLLPALLVAAALARVPAPAAGAGGAVRDAVAGADRPRAFALLTLVASLRAGAYFALQAFLAATLVHELGASNATGNAALAALLAAGAAGTVAGGRLADRLGHRAAIAGGLAATVPGVALTLLAPTAPLAVIAAALLGFAVSSGYSATVVLGQELLPTRPTLAAGTTLGLAIGAGGVIVAALGPLADAAGPAAALWAVIGLAAAGALLARGLPHRAAAGRRTGLAGTQA
jgi:FSR family fosmidomycin resistance protein-like MFS transporter